MYKNLIILACKICNFLVSSNPVVLLKTASVAMISIIILFSTIANAEQPSKEEDLCAEVMQDSRKMLQVVKDIDKNKDKVLTDQDINSMQLGVFSDYMKVMNRIRNDVSKIEAEYGEFLDKTVSAALDTKILSNKKSRNMLKLELNKVNTNALQAKKQIETVFKKSILELSKINVPVDIDSSQQYDFKNGLETPRAYWNKYFELQIESIEVIRNIYKFLDKHEGRFYYDNNQLVFEKDADLLLFNDLVSSLSSNIDRQEALNKSYQEFALSKIENLESILE